MTIRQAVHCAEFDNARNLCSEIRVITGSIATRYLSPDQLGNAAGAGPITGRPSRKPRRSSAARARPKMTGTMGHRFPREIALVWPANELDRKSLTLRFKTVRCCRHWPDRLSGSAGA